MRNILQILLDENEALLYDWLYFCPPKYTSEIPTMAVNKNKQLFINEKFVNTLTDDELVGCLYHETLHNIYGHCLAKGEPYLVNVAGDIYINEMLHNIYKLPKEGFFKKTFQVPDTCVTCQEIYDWLEVNLPKKVAQQLQLDYQMEEAVINENEMSNENDEVLSIVFKKIAGKLSENFNKINTNEIKISWDLDLQIEIGRLIKRDIQRNFIRPPRVEISNIIRPANIKNIKIPKIHVYIDTSGSMETTLSIVVNALKETKKKLKEYLPKYFGFNTEIYTLDEKDIEEDAITCGGGTAFTQVVEGADLHVIITDGELDFDYINNRKDIIVYLCSKEQIIRK